MIRWKSSLCTVSPASEVYNRTAYRRFANGHAAGRPPSRETSTVPRSQGKRPMTAAVNSRPPSTGGGHSRSRNRPHTAVRCLHFCTCWYHHCQHQTHECVCLLPVACCLLPVVCCLLSVVCCLLSVVCRLLSVVCYLLSVVCCLCFLTDLDSIQGARIEGQVPTPGEGSGAGRNRGFMQVPFHDSASPQIKTSPQRL